MDTCWRCGIEIEDGTTCECCADDFGTMSSEEIRLIDFIVEDGMRNGMSSMAEHPQYKELHDIQYKLYGGE